MTNIIISVHPCSESEALDELKNNFSGRVISKLYDHVFLYKTEMPFSKFSNAIKEKHICFIRHIVPVHFEYSLSRDENDFQILPKEIKSILLKMKGKELILHVSFLTKALSYDKKSFITPLLETLQQNEISVNHKAKEILSLILTNETMYVGVSNEGESLTSWPLGYPHYAFKDEQICRAEFKIIESIDLFKVDLSKYKRAIDLGAAPGGWTRLLLEQGMSVIAIDPAELDPSLFKYKKLIHYKGLSQNFFKDHHEKYDLIVNDMRMDVKSSVKIIREAAHHLSNTGFVIMTLKLNPYKKLLEIKYALEELRKGFHIKAIRQLYHNRSEATVLLEKKHL